MEPTDCLESRQLRGWSGRLGEAFLLVTLWTWAIWSCAEHWRGNPNYSYGWAVPVLALGFGFRRYLMWTGRASPPERLPSGLTIAIAGVLATSVAFALEYAREEMWHPEITLWSICLLVTCGTLAVFYRAGGAELARAEAFPVLFFLTSVPWPPRFEQPLTAGLMQSVAAATTEILHWLGVEAQTSGGAIALQSGLVGITEACSGIRSLQAGIMFGLAMGEWFLLRPRRRAVLLGIAIAMALLTNLVRTLTLALHAERHGAGTVEQVHDLVGNIVITSLVLGIWIAGKWLSEERLKGDRTTESWLTRLRAFRSTGVFKWRPVYTGIGVGLVAGIFGARFVCARADAASGEQTSPRFSAQPDSAGRNRLLAVPREVWNELRPTSGEYIRRAGTGSPNDSGDCYHFFWKPSVWNRFALVHRPDICMPGIGWQPAGRAPETIDLEMQGRPVRFYLFRFRRGDIYALELWGAWRNGIAVPLEYTPDQVFGNVPAPATLALQGKRRSATEIVACSVIADGSEPASEIAVALLRSVFHYRSDE
jgi:exosortase